MEKLNYLNSPRKILLPRFDTFGDIVLLEGFIKALQSKFPNAEITLLVREGYDDLGAVFPLKVRWITSQINPFAGISVGYQKKLQLLLDQLVAERFDLVLVTTFNRTWLDTIIAAKLIDPFCVGFNGEEVHKDLVHLLASEMNLNLEFIFDKIVLVTEQSHETEKYSVLWQSLFADNLTLPFPSLKYNTVALLSAQAFLAKHGMEQKNFYICVVTATAGLPHKRWPADRFLKVMEWLYCQHGMRPLLIGHRCERKTIIPIAKAAKQTGISPVVWLGKNGEVGILAALIAQGCFYFGNDTGPMHIAAAIGIPVVGIFGGGHWPRFLPCGDNAVAVAGKLPCFGCNWDCLFLDAPCVKLVDVSDVVDVLEQTLKGTPVHGIKHARHEVSHETSKYITKAKLKFNHKTENDLSRYHQKISQIHKASKNVKIFIPLWLLQVLSRLCKGYKFLYLKNKLSMNRRKLNSQ